MFFEKQEINQQSINNGASIYSVCNYCSGIISDLQIAVPKHIPRAIPSVP